MPTRSVAVIATAVLLAALALSPAAESAGTLAKRVATALRVAKAADHRSRLALAQTARVTGGPTGPAGTPGSTGQVGSVGANGHDGASVVGPAGPAGRDGASASMQRPVSVSNDAGVFLGTAPTDVLKTTVTANGWLMVVANAQANGEMTADSVLCEIRFDGRALDDQYQPLAPGDQRTLALSSVTDTPAGPHVVALTCHKGAVASSVEVPLGRARLSVVTG